MRANLFILFLIYAVSSFGQFRKSDRISISVKDAPLEAIFDSLSAQTDYFFSYNTDLLPKGSLYTISAENEPIDQFLSRLFIGTGLKYSFFKDQIILHYEAPQLVVKKKNFFTISGTVYDENGQPLNSANVFLDGTTIGVSSDIDGNYKLESIPPGFYNIVFSHVGYENAVYQLSEINGGARIQNHQMELDLGQLEEVEVISNRIRRTEDSWLAYYLAFKKELIGLTENADKCVIENPEALDFTYNRGANALRAYASEPLQIRNDALGYRITYFLESFRKENDGDLRFRGKIRFRNLAAMNGAEKREWKRNRKESYYGSFNHFKKSLLDGNLRKDGYRIYRLRDLEKFEMKKENELTEADILVFKGNHYELDFNNHLIVEYRRERESRSFLRNSSVVDVIYSEYITPNGILAKDPGNQISIIRLLRGSLRLDLSGEIMDKFGVTTFGYWSWERTADLVPINYDPKYDNL
ncbi:carboxypeptidase-like regulatory domain-containing protein [Ekhidna sp.]|uniref:carboxypeptidase-like regulatory domain-containing protein n=1 Tax=Ekhidna sp. TaxID=2608089 RepID=UPI003BAB99B6